MPTTGQAWEGFTRRKECEAHARTPCVKKFLAHISTTCSLVALVSLGHSGFLFTTLSSGLLIRETIKLNIDELDRVWEHPEIIASGVLDSAFPSPIATIGFMPPQYQVTLGKVNLVLLVAGPLNFSNVAAEQEHLMAHES